jgi:ribosome-associated toxin RatA of RatAB toxin-antitoxin module
LHIHERVEFAGDPLVVWQRLSDIDRIPEFWHGTRSLEIISRDKRQGRETVRARVKFAFGGGGEVEITADEATRTLTSDYRSGPFKGIQAVSVGGNAIEADWDVGFTGLFKLTSSWTGKHFRSGTLHALERLCSGSPVAETA